MKKKIIFLLPLLCMHLYAVKAQLSQRETGISGFKGASSSGTGGSMGSLYSPDMFTGTVNVNIPIYSYAIDGLDLGVSLGYNTKGIKVDQIASEVGLG